MAPLPSQPIAVNAVIPAPLLSRSRWVNILPVVFIMYTISFIDRTNFGIALPFIRDDLHLTATQAGFAGGVFFWGYIVTQLLTGLLLLKINSRNLVFFCLILWGMTAVGTFFVQSFQFLLVARILLGVFEGPVFAATSSLLTQWFIKAERGRAFGIWNLSSPVGAFLAGPLSGILLAHYDWRIMMVMEGLPALIWAVLWWWRIPNSMAEAKWLSLEEKNYVQSVLEQEQAILREREKDKKNSSGKWYGVLYEPSVWLTFIGFSLVSLSLSGYTMWLPSVLKSFNTLPIEAVGLISGLPFITAILGIFFITRHSDRHHQERRWHASIPCVITGIILITATNIPDTSYVVKIILSIISGFTMKMFLPLIFTRLSEILPKGKSASSVAIVNGLGNLFGGSVGSILIGYLWQTTHSYTVGFTMIGVAGIIGGGVLALIRNK